MTNALLLARRLGMDIDDHGIAAVADRAGRKLLGDGRKRIVERLHKEHAEHADHQDARAVPCRVDVGAAPRRAGRVVERTQEALLARREDQRLALIPNVVAGGHAVGPGIDDRLEGLLGDAKATGGVLAVHHDEIEAVPLDQSWKEIRDDDATGASHDIAQKEQLHAEGSATTSSFSVAIIGSRTSCGSSGMCSTS
jgi:hypothetical protein